MEKLSPEQKKQRSNDYLRPNYFALKFNDDGNAILYYNWTNNAYFQNKFYAVNQALTLSEFSSSHYSTDYNAASGNYEKYLKSEQNAIILGILQSHNYKNSDITEYSGRYDSSYKFSEISISQNNPIQISSKVQYIYGDIQYKILTDVLHSFTLSGNKITYSSQMQPMYYKRGTINKEIFTSMSTRTSVDLNFIEVPKLSKENLVLLAKKSGQEKIIAENNAKKQAESERLAKIKYNQERIKNLKLVQVGDRICFSQGWVHHKEYKVFLGVGNVESQNYTMRVISYVERKEGDRYQIRVANIESSNNNNWSYPKLNGVELKEQSLHWIKPNDYLNNIEWSVCE